MKRLIYEVRWDKKSRVWWLAVRGLEASVVQLRRYRTKADAEAWGRTEARNWWEARGQPTQLLIYTKSGRIGKGGRNEASYGCDSPRRKG